MKNLSIPTSLSVRGKQTKTAFRANKGMASRGTFEDVGIDPFPTVGIKKAHKVYYGLTSSAHRAMLTNKMPGAVIYRGRIFRAHIHFLRLPTALVQSSPAFIESLKTRVKNQTFRMLKS